MVRSTTALEVDVAIAFLLFTFASAERQVEQARKNE